MSVVYDGDGNRVSETVGGVTTKYLVDTLNPTGLPQVMDEVVGGTVTRTYAYGLQRISENQLVGSTWTPSFYGYDGHGSVRFLTGNAGTITDSYTYDAFGLPITTTGTTPNNFLYSGEQYDSALGMYYLRARYYNPATGRLLSIDPFRGNLLSPPSLHKYIYSENDPVNASDPSGQDVIVEVAFLYTRNNFGVLAAARVKFDPWEVLNTAHEYYERYDKVSFAYGVAQCDNNVLALAASALGSLDGGPPVSSSIAGNASNKFLGCLYNVFKELVNPIPGIDYPFPEYP